MKNVFVTSCCRKNSQITFSDRLKDDARVNKCDLNSFQKLEQSDDFQKLEQFGDISPYNEISTESIERICDANQCDTIKEKALDVEDVNKCVFNSFQKLEQSGDILPYEVTESIERICDNNQCDIYVYDPNNFNNFEEICELNLTNEKCIEQNVDFSFEDDDWMDDLEDATSSDINSDECSFCDRYSDIESVGWYSKFSKILTNFSDNLFVSVMTST